MQNPFDDLPGFDLLRQALNFGQAPQPQPAPAENRSAKPGGAKGAGGGGGSRSAGGNGGGAKTKTTSSSADKAWDDSPAEIGEHNPEPVADPVETKAKATLKKVGWVQDKTQFKSEAEIFAEFAVPASKKHRTLVEFQLLIQEKGEFKVIETAKGHADANGRATAKVPIRKPAEGERVGDKAAAATKVTFALKTKHCTADWSKETGTEREVTETAEQGFEHTQVSGIHFTQNKSFIAPQYLKVFRELESEYKTWRAERDAAKIVIYGHAERDEEDPRKLSARRSQAAFAFLIGDYHMWNRIATEERWGLWEQQHMLQALGFYAGKVDGISGPATKKAIRDFITWLNENECKNLNPLLGLTEEHIRLELYRVYITGAKRTVIMPSSHFRLVSGNPFVGCGAFNRYKGGNESFPENRRATFLLIADSFSFPVTFPCRSSTSGPCESETQKLGERAVKGFGCKFYDEVMQKEKAGEGVDAQNLASQKGLLDDPLIQRILFYKGTVDNEAISTMSEILNGTRIVSRGNCPKNTAKPIQRALIYLSYPTGTQGTYSIDGDFGNGTNKGYAHFLREWKSELLVNEQNVRIEDKDLIMQATYATVKEAVSQLDTVPVKKDGLQLLLDAIKSASTSKEVYLRDVESAIENIDLIEKNTLLSIRDIISRFKESITEASEYGQSKGFAINPTWIAAFAKTETGGLPRPKFEHHWLYNYYSGKSKGGVVSQNTLTNIRECRLLSTSFGMGQLMGANHTMTPLASSAKDLYYMNESNQFKVIVDFLIANKSKCSVVLQDDVSSASDVEDCVKAYNGPSYKTNNYHNILFKNFKESKEIWGAA